MRKLFVAVIIVLAVSSQLKASEPTVDTIDYQTPSKYLSFPSSLGNQTEISKQAEKLIAKTERETVLNVLLWMDENFKYTPKKAYQWRNYDTVVKEGCYASCADQGIVCGVLLKSAGIPTVWVKTMDVAWIWDLKKKRKITPWSGHVFLEIYLDGSWVLLDPGAKTFYRDYSPQSRILPGNRFAYHKGNDPEEMVMSLQWEEWKKQTKTYFSSLDESLLPVDPKSATSLSRECFIIANSPYYQALSEMGARKKMKIRKSFNTNYDEFIPQAMGHTILIETHSGVPIVDRKILKKHFPEHSEKLSSARGVVVLGETTLVFVDFDNLLSPLD